MAVCAMCGRELPQDPNEMDTIIECRYCEAVLCSEECAADHEAQAHAEEALPAEEEDDER